jgi:quinol monooxygenase YgiN
VESQWSPGGGTKSGHTLPAPPASDGSKHHARLATPGEVQQLLLENPRRIEQGEPGNLAFGVHRSIDNPDEFWLYATWTSGEAVEAHESGAAFQRYKEALRPLVDPDSVLLATASRLRFSAIASSPRQRPAPRRGNRDHQGVSAPTPGISLGQALPLRPTPKSAVRLGRWRQPASCAATTAARAALDRQRHTSYIKRSE